MRLSYKRTTRMLPVIIFGLFLQQLKSDFYTANAQYSRPNLPQQSPYGQQIMQRGQRTFCRNDTGFPLRQDKKLVPIQTVRNYQPTISDRAINGTHSEITLCCRGYRPKEIRNQKFCVPVCDNCRNGQCVAPNECECYEGFVRNDNGDCIFYCPLGCVNGRCYLDGSCQCDPGYKLDPSQRFCRPICSKGCGSSPFANCTAPEVCGCNSGYVLTEFGCQKSCSPDCGIGGECKNGMCVCNPGFTLKDDVCQSECYQSCVNGICYSPNRCICNPGFVYEPKSTSCKRPYPIFKMSPSDIIYPKIKS